MNYKIPEFIETDRLILRTLEEKDWKDLFKYYSDEICMTFTAKKVLTECET